MITKKFSVKIKRQQKLWRGKYVALYKYSKKEESISNVFIQFKKVGKIIQIKSKLTNRKQKLGHIKAEFNESI